MNDLLTIAELAAILKVKPKTISNMIARGIFKEKVHFVRPAGLGTRFKESAITAWLEDGESKSTVTFPVRSMINGRR